MWRYYFLLGLRSLRRNPVLTALMVATLAIGVAASISTLTILHVMAGDPIAHKSDRLLVPLMDNGPLRTYVPGEKDLNNVQMAWQDVRNLLDSGQGLRRTALYDIGGSVEPARNGDPVVDLQGIATTSDFFAMFEAPVARGGAWSAREDAAAARVAMLSGTKATALFGTDDPVGRRIRIWNAEFTVVGVIDDWHPTPRYMHVVNGSGGTFNGEEQVYVPLSTAIALELPSNGSTNCSDDAAPGFQGLLKSECTWLQFWFELGAAADRTALQGWLDAYTNEQSRRGRFQRRAPNRLFDVMQWLDYLEVVSRDNHAAVWLALGFLVLCTVNATGLLLAKFSVRAPEVGVRRALGASRMEIFRQFLVEAGVIGLAGGLLGLLLSLSSLWLIRLQSKDLSTVARMDWQMLAATFGLAIAASLLAGLLPTWRASHVTPALQLKSQ